MKTSRMFFSEVERRFDAMPFTLRYGCFQERENFKILIKKEQTWLIYFYFFNQGVWGWVEGPSGCGGMCKTWIAAAVYRAAGEGGWVFAISLMYLTSLRVFLLSHCPCVYSQESLSLSSSSQCCWWPTVLTESPTDCLIPTSTSQRMKYRTQNLRLGLHQIHCKMCWVRCSNFATVLQTLLQSSASRKTQKKKKKKVGYSLCLT